MACKKKARQGGEVDKKDKPKMRQGGSVERRRALKSD